MKKLLLAILLCAPLLAAAQGNKIKETAVPQSVLLTLERTYASYKVKTWYQAPGQYIADIIIDGQHGRSYFTASGDWQYSEFPIIPSACPTRMRTYFDTNYNSTFRINQVVLIEEMSGDSYYNMTIGERNARRPHNYVLRFDTRGNLQNSGGAPDPAVVKREFAARNADNAAKTKKERKKEEEEANNPKRRGKPQVDEPAPVVVAPTETIKATFEKTFKRLEDGPIWVMRLNGNGADEMVAYFVNSQGQQMEAVFDMETEVLKCTGKHLEEDRYPAAIVKYIDEKFNDRNFRYEKMVTYEFNSKYRDPLTQKKPKPYTYVVISERDYKNRGQMIFTRMEFDSTNKFTGLLAQPLDRLDVDNKNKTK